MRVGLLSKCKGIGKTRGLDKGERKETRRS